MSHANPIPAGLCGLVLATLAILTPCVAAQRVDLLHDINRSVAPADPTQLTRVNGMSFFTITDRRYGNELWVTDSTQKAARLVADLRPGPASSAPRLFGSFGGKLLFAATDGTHGRELWESDGTSTGTKMIADVRKGAANFFSHLYDANQPPDVAFAGGRCYFVGTHDSYGRELWSYDGTTIALVRDIRAGPVGSSPAALTAVGTECWFHADDGTLGYEPYRSSGTSSSTMLVADIEVGAGNSFASGFTRYKQDVVFSARRRSIGRELWKTHVNSTTTSLVADVVPGTLSSSPEQFLTFGGKLYFLANGNPSRLNFTAQLWSTDGTTAGTKLVSSHPMMVNYATELRLRAVAGELIFGVKNHYMGLGETFVSDGVTSTLLGSDNHFVDDDGALALMFNPTQSKLFTYAKGKSIDIGSVTAKATQISSSSFGASNPTLVITQTRAGDEVWTSAGVTAGKVARLRLSLSTPTEPSTPENFITCASRVLFTVRAPKPELWATDGTVNGAVRLLDSTHRVSAAYRRFAGKIWFTVKRRNESYLWSTDGTAAGTQRFGSQAFPQLRVSATLVVGPKHMWFRDISTPHDIYITDGSVAGTKRLPLQNVAHYWNLLPQHAIGDQVLLSARVSSSAMNFLIADQKGRHRVLIDWMTTPNAIPVGRSDRRAYFYHRSTSASHTLVAFDGKKLSSLQLSTGLVGFRSIYEVDADRILLAQADGLWVYDLAKNTRTMLHTSAPSWITRSGSRFFVALSDAAHGEEVWITDGSPSGTKLLHDIAPGRASSKPSRAYAYGDRGIVFVAIPRDGPRRSYFSDGSPTGLIELIPQPSTPGAVLRDKIVISAAIDNVGQEVFTIQGLGARSIPLAHSCGGATQGRTPTLVSSRPKLGSLITVTLTEGPASGTGVLTLAAPLHRAGTLPGGCPIGLDLTLASLWPMPANGRTQFFLPKNPALQGIHVWLRAFLIKPQGISSGIETTNVVDWVLENT